MGHEAQTGVFGEGRTLWQLPSEPGTHLKLDSSCDDWHRKTSSPKHSLDTAFSLGQSYRNSRAPLLSRKAIMFQNSDTSKSHQQQVHWAKSSIFATVFTSEATREIQSKAHEPAAVRKFPQFWCSVTSKIQLLKQIEIHTTREFFTKKDQ